MDKKYYEGENKIIDNREPVPMPVQESPSQIIHGKILNVGDKLDVISTNVSEKLSPVMKDYPKQPETNHESIVNSGLPPLFEQYAELIDHIELVIEDINIKLSNVSI